MDGGGVPPAGGAAELPDDLLVCILTTAMGGTLSATNVVRWKARSMALCGRRAPALLDRLCPDAARVVRRLYRTRTALVWAAYQLRGRPERDAFDGNRACGLAYRLEWSDGAASFVWFVDEPFPYPLHEMRERFRTLMGESDITRGRRPKRVSVHATMLRVRAPRSPFPAEETCNVSVLLRHGAEPHVIRWVHSRPQHSVAVDPV